MIKDHLFRCDSISQQLPLSVGGSVIHSFRLESYVFTCIYNVNTCIIYIVYIHVYKVYDMRYRRWEECRMCREVWEVSTETIY